MARVQLGCRLCGRLFMAVRRTVMYCSRSCRGKATYMSKKEREAHGRGRTKGGAKIHILDFDDSESARRQRADQQAFNQASYARRQLALNGYPIWAA